MSKQDAIKEIISALKQKKLSKADLSRFKLKICKKYGIVNIPKDIDIFLNSSTADMKKIGLVSKPIRSSSGVSVVAVMTRPFKCPHGKCLYCPGGPKSFFGEIPQSYTGKEPATMRAMRNSFDSYLQVFNRLEQYVASGHLPDKIELIIMGGTFPSFPADYQKEFIAYALKAMNDFGDLFFSKGSLDFVKYKSFFEMPGNMRDEARVQRVIDKVLKLKHKSSLEREQNRNESSKIRCIAMCLETRPDFCFESHLNSMLNLGTTRIELGVQSLSNSVLKKIKRGHSVEDSIKATRLMKDCFMKVGYHVMPGLPGSKYADDVKMFKELFKNPDFRPDALKIYPCMVIKGTELYNLWKKGKFLPLQTKKAALLIASAKKFVPKYVRIMRVQRDISTHATVAGVDRTNLRQYVEQILKEKKQECSCIRCREPRNKEIDFKSIKILTQYYEASKGSEVFISAEDTKNNILLGFCRLRIPYKPFRKEITKESAGIRELHVYGSAVPIGEKGSSIQHKGLGKQLLKEAERIARDVFGKKKLLVISGIGARAYYKKLGYKKDGVYVSKRLH